MDNVYSNPGVPTFHLEERQEGKFVKDTDGIQANTERQGPAAKQRTPVGQCAAGVPCRYALALVAVLYLVLLGGLIALGVLYMQICYRSGSLEEENSKLSVSLSALKQRVEDMQICYRLGSLEGENKKLSVSLSAIKQRLEDMQICYRLGSLEEENKKLSVSLSAIKQRLEGCCAENRPIQHFQSGMELRITGVPQPNPVKFRINMGHSKQMIALCIELMIGREDEDFYIILPDESKINFPNRLGDKQYPFLSMEGDVTIHSISVK